MNDLSFTSERNNWNVSPTGDFQEDCLTGNKYAHEFLAWVHDHRKDDGSIMLTFVLEAMGLDTKGDGLKIGFLAEVGEALLWTGYRKEDIRQEFRALQECVHRLDAVLKAVEHDQSDCSGLSEAGELLMESGQEACSVAMNLLDELPKALGIDVGASAGEAYPLREAYQKARSADRAAIAGVQS